MKQLFKITLLTLAITGCSDMIEAERQHNLERCQRACNSVFSDYPTNYNQCMNAGMDSYGYYQGSACETYIEPHRFCQGAGLVPNQDAVNQSNAYSDCIIEHKEKQADRDLTRDVTENMSTPTQKETCITDRFGIRTCSTQ